jgi:hypothetical protein
MKNLAPVYPYDLTTVPSVIQFSPFYTLLFISLAEHRGGS